MEINIPLENAVSKSSELSICGSEWLPICTKCHEQIGDCCRNIEINLFPDEVELFQQRDGKHVMNYEDNTFGYKKDTCCFLMEDNRCELQFNGITKPVDCLIYPLNFKNGNMYLDTSCNAKALLNRENAKKLLYDKLKKFPHYVSVEYLVQETDEYLEPLPKLGKKL